MPHKLRISGERFLNTLSYWDPLFRSNIIVEHDEYDDDFFIEKITQNHVEISSSERNLRVPRTKARKMLFEVKLEGALRKIFSDALREEQEIEDVHRLYLSLGWPLPYESKPRLLSQIYSIAKIEGMPAFALRQEFYRASKELIGGNFSSNCDFLRACGKLVSRWIGGCRQPFEPDIHINGAFYWRHSGNPKEALLFTEIIEEVWTDYFSKRCELILATERAAALLDLVEFHGQTDMVKPKKFLDRAYSISKKYCINNNEFFENISNEDPVAYLERCYGRYRHLKKHLEY